MGRSKVQAAGGGRAESVRNGTGFPRSDVALASTSSSVATGPIGAGATVGWKPARKRAVQVSQVVGSCGAVEPGSRSPLPDIAQCHPTHHAITFGYHASVGRVWSKSIPAHFFFRYRDLIGCAFIGSQFHYQRQHARNIGWGSRSNAYFHNDRGLISYKGLTAPQ